MKTCAHCGKEFELKLHQSGDPIVGQKYCRKQCRDRSAEKPRRGAKKLRRKMRDNFAPCPHPAKFRYWSWEDAATRTFELDQGMHAYRCCCGAIHYGHSKERRDVPVAKAREAIAQSTK